MSPNDSPVNSSTSPVSLQGASAVSLMESSISWNNLQDKQEKEGKPLKVPFSFKFGPTIALTSTNLKKEKEINKEEEYSEVSHLTPLRIPRRQDTPEIP